jgi:hypothetical protein
VLALNEALLTPQTFSKDLKDAAKFWILLAEREISLGKQKGQVQTQPFPI